MTTSITTIRAALREKFGARRYRIDAAGYIHAFGRAPNSQFTGWYLFGSIYSAETLVALGVQS
jgi:hypothetical protein